MPKLAAKLTFAVATAGLALMLAIPSSGQGGSSGLDAVILGSGSPSYNPDRAGPAVLIRDGDTEVLIDTGNGVQARLSEENVRIRDLDAILFTHQHLDHNEEFVPVFIQALLGGNRFTLGGPAPLGKMASTTLDLYDEDISYRFGRRGQSADNLSASYDLKEISGATSFMIGDIQVTTAPVNHTIETYAYRFDAGGKSIVISGDLTYSESLSKLAKDADYLIIDSGGTIREGQQNRRRPNAGNNRGNQSGERPRQGGGNASRGDGRQRAHVTLAETARMASEAGAKTIVLTHFTVGTIDESATIAELRKAYSGEVLFAADGMTLGD